jgi:hypothetical protein
MTKNALADTYLREYAGSAHQQALTVEVTATAPDLVKCALPVHEEESGCCLLRQPLHGANAVRAHISIFIREQDRLQYSKQQFCRSPRTSLRFRVLRVSGERCAAAGSRKSPAYALAGAKELAERNCGSGPRFSATGRLESGHFETWFLRRRLTRMHTFFSRKLCHCLP